MRVLWLQDWQPPAVRRHLALEPMAGPQAWVDRLAAVLCQRPGVELSIAVPGRRRFAPFEDGGVRYLCVPVTAPRTRTGRIVKGWTHHLTSESALGAAAALVRQADPAIVHVHGTEGASGLLAGGSPPAPFVISLQGILQAYERRYFAGRTPLELARLAASPEFVKGRGVIHGYLWLRRTAAREARIMRGGRWFIGRTAWDRKELVRANPEAEYFHCDEIMRPPFYEVRWADVEHGGQTVYSTSGAMPGKGAECLLEALALLRRRPGHEQARLRIAGMDPGSEMGAIYRRKARDLGIEASVEWLGRLDAARIAGELQAADVFAYPSHADNSPNAVVEAMLVGAPIVAADVGGIPSLVRRDEEGLLVPRGDAAALAAAIARLLVDRAVAASLGAAARTTAARRNAPELVADDVLAIYAEVRRRWTALGA